MAVSGELGEGEFGSTQIEYGATGRFQPHCEVVMAAVLMWLEECVESQIL